MQLQLHHSHVHMYVLKAEELAAVTQRHVAMSCRTSDSKQVGVSERAVWLQCYHH